MPELLDERVARVLVGRQRLGLAPGTVEREHQLGTRPFAERLGGDDRLELADELRMTPEREIGVDPILDRGDAQLFQAAASVAANGSPATSASAGPRQRPSAAVNRSAASSVAPPTRRRARLRGQALEAGEVELVGLDADRVAAAASLQAVGAERTAQAGHVDLHRLRRAGRRGLAPEGVDEALDGDRLVGVEQEDGEERALLRAAERQRPIALADLERPQEPELHRPSKSSSRALTALSRHLAAR